MNEKGKVPYRMETPNFNGAKKISYVITVDGRFGATDTPTIARTACGRCMFTTPLGIEQIRAEARSSQCKWSSVSRARCITNAAIAVRGGKYAPLTMTALR